MCGIHAWVTVASTEPPPIDDAWLQRRGPDGSSTVSLSCGVSSSTTRVHLTASVLQMRSEWQPQPVRLTGTSLSDNAFLAWNGEIYNVNTNAEDAPDGDMPWLFHSNDTKYLAMRLQSISLLNGENIATVLQSLTNAEYAVCIITDQSVFYARDPWGRRSLLSEHHDHPIKDNNDASPYNFQLASVATSGLHSWKEVPPGIVYEYRISTGDIFETPFVSMEPLPMPLPDTPETASETLEVALDRAVQHRLRGHDSCSVLFSGGLDSTLIAALALRYCQNVTLLTVSFVENDGGESPPAADTLTAKASFHELRELYPDALLTWNHRAVPYGEIQAANDRIGQLIHPKSTVMDWNIATALWFASSLKADRLLLSGLGADELLGGYRRHKQASEVQRDQDRLWERNLGRDDRVLSDHGTEVRFPFLDTEVVQFCRSAQDFLLQENKDTSTDKSVLRKVAARMKLTTAAIAAKRAIQFGSRMAHVSDTKRFGSRRKATATALVEKT